MEGPQVETALTGPSIIAIIIIIRNNVIIMLFLLKTSNKLNDGVQQTDHLGVFSHAFTYNVVGGVS